MHKRVETEDETPPPEPNFFLDVVLPIILIPIGIALCFVQRAMYFDKGSPKPFSMIAGTTIVSMLASLGLMVATPSSAPGARRWEWSSKGRCGRRF